MLKNATLAAIAALSLGTAGRAVEDTSSPAPIDVGISVTPTSFFARNFSGTDQVLLFKSGDALVWRTLPPGCDMQWTFPLQQLDGVELEVASWVDGYWHRTGSMMLTDITGVGADAVWVQAGASEPSWTEVGSTLLLENTGPSFFPSSLPTATSEGSDADDLLMGPLHTPGITPIDVPKGDVPPKLEDQPLPPV